MKLLKGPFFIKVAAVLFALFTYFYIQSELKNTEKKVTDPSYKLIKLTAKSLPVRVRLATEAPEGYKILDDKVSANPKEIIVIGPEALLEEASTAETALVDVGESTRTVIKKIPLESVAGIHVGGNSYYVEVTVPIEKTEPKPESNQ